MAAVAFFADCTDCEWKHASTDPIARNNEARAHADEGHTVRLAEGFTPDNDGIQ